MTSPNTINREEYAKRLYDACRRMKNAIGAISWQEESNERNADNIGDDEKALRHYFNQIALQMAIDAITKSPNELLTHTAKSR